MVSVEAEVDVYADAKWEGMVGGCYEFQRAMLKGAPGKTLNAASADDPAKLSDFGAINLDVQSFEPWTKKQFNAAKNFVHGTVFDIPFPEEEFETVVLGEFLEHCKFEKAVEAVRECRRVLKPGGRLVLTIPLDGRPRREQEVYHKESAVPDEYVPGVTTYHQTWWSNQMLYDLRRATKMIESVRVPLIYLMTAPVGGWGLVWNKP